MYNDDIETLPSIIPSTYNHKTILAAQIRLLLRNLPLALLGTIFTSICFFATMFVTYDLNANQQALNTIWLAYHSIVIGVLWLSVRLILKRPDALTITFLKKIFAALALLFFSAMIIFLPIFIAMLQRVPIMEINAAKLLIMIWMFFHLMILYVCWFNWQKIKALAKNTTEDCKNLNSSNKDYSSTSSLNDQSLVKPSRSFFTLTYEVPSPSAKNHDHYLAHYAVYSVLFICTLATACLWALAIGKAFTTNIQNSTQVIVLLGLHLGLLSGGISSLAMFWRVYIAYALPSILMWGFLLFYMVDTGFIILAFAVITLLFFDIFFAKHTSTNTLKAILIYLENNSLVAQLQIKTRQVEKASSAKTQFLAAASHDLRQPIQALSLFIEALKDTDLDSQQAQIVDYASSASQSSREMLNSVLDYAHLESGEMTPHFVATELNSILQNLVDEFGIQAQNKQLSLRFKPTTLCVMTDPIMLALILRNLISNAIRYTHKGGVLIGVRKLPVSHSSLALEYCRISIWDTGSGLTPQEIEQAFKSFHQIERNNVTNQGLGLGLAIVKGMTDLLKADLEVKSTLHQGSQFSITLPICEKDDKTTFYNNTAINHLAGKTVLVVDDDDILLKSMQLLLEVWGCKAVAAQTVAEAVAAFKVHQPDIVISDYRLADKETGEEVIIAIQNASSTANYDSASFILLTANTSPKLLKATKAINPTILHKPIDPLILRHHLQQLTAKAP
ncbi:ATP-binding response regulator [Psychrobacter sp. 2Y5]|uniref:ATP-binding response regulator n=1 Tax=unclassified Psychrobacter TaxID=196806 RepID=UPI003F472026